MKPIKTMKQASSGLKSFIDQLPAGELGSWEEFRNHNAGKSYKELISELISLQRGLCGYCEIDLVELDQEVEHIIPKSDPKIGKKYALDHLNLMACCKGGSSIKRNQVARYKEPVKMNLSCGASKLDEVITSFVDPRSLSAIAFVTKSNSSGKLVADYENCKSAGIDVQSVNDTIEFLNLNVNRLVLARRKIWGIISNSAEGDDRYLIARRLHTPGSISNRRGSRYLRLTCHILCFFSASSTNQHSPSSDISTRHCCTIRSNLSSPG